MKTIPRKLFITVQVTVVAAIIIVTSINVGHVARRQRMVTDSQALTESLSGSYGTVMNTMNGIWRQL